MVMNTTSPLAGLPAFFGLVEVWLLTAEHAPDVAKDMLTTLARTDMVEAGIVAVSTSHAMNESTAQPHVLAATLGSES